MTRSVRLLASLVAIFALLFSQLALAAHGCERLAKHSPHCAHMVPPAQDEAPSNLCVKHCEEGKASIDVAKPLTPVGLSSTFLSIPLPVLPLASAQRSVPPATPHPPPASFAARSAALRI